MKVITLTSTQLSQAARQLAGVVVNGHKEQFAAIVGVITGGAVIADLMQPHLPAMERFDILFQRPSTASKNKAVRLFAVLKRLPRFVSDWLRMAESQYLYLRSRGRKSVSRRPVLSDSLSAFVADLPSGSSILLVDDSVDSGATVAGCIEALGNVNPDVKVVVAALTVTMPDPLVEPDFRLFEGRTLVRFPWSKDYRE